MMRYSSAICFLSLGALIGLRLSRGNTTRQTQLFGVCFLVSALAWKWQTCSHGDGLHLDTVRVIPHQAASAPTDHSSDTALTETQREQMNRAMEKLTPREREIIQMRYGMDNGTSHTLAEVGTRFGLPREQVRHIELRVLSKLRRMRRRDNQA